MFINSPFEILEKAFKNLYPDKTYRSYIVDDIKDEDGGKAYGCTTFIENEAPVIAISADLTIKDATEVFAHELAHVAAGERVGHGNEWEKEFQKLFDEYNRIGQERFGFLAGTEMNSIANEEE